MVKTVLINMWPVYTGNTLENDFFFLGQGKVREFYDWSGKFGN